MGAKLAAVLALPTVATLVLAGVQTRAVAAEAGELAEFTRQVGLSRQITTLVHEVQLERDRTVGELAAVRRSAAPSQVGARVTPVLQPIHRSADTAVQAYRRAVAPVRDGPEAWQSAVGGVDYQLNQLDQLRSGVLGGSMEGALVADGYSRVLSALLILLAQPSAGETHAELNQPVQAYVELARAKEVNSKLRARMSAIAGIGRLGTGDAVALAELRLGELTALTQFHVIATAAQVRTYADTLASQPSEEASTVARLSTAAAAGRIAGLDRATWWTTSTNQHNLIRQVEAGLVDDAVRTAQASSSALRQRTALIAGSVLLVLLAAIAASAAIGRQMVRSLRQLRGQALVVAHAELPRALEQLRAPNARDPVIQVAPPAVRSADEIGEVAQAFHAVHRSVVELALEQARTRRSVTAIVVNLARRSQVLVERQLELLDRLERDEADPDQLSNLFQIDHLAARMRRNDDNLLVLAGSESRRRWTGPIALSTVVLAGAAEIEQYARVRHDIDDQLYVVGPVVGDLAHLLAELLENATMFSPPDGPVVVTAAIGPGGRIAVLEIIDAGLGMSPQALFEANQALAVPTPVDLAAAERMGLVVVSHLAARHGIRVELQARAMGLTARVSLPPELLVPAGSLPDSDTFAGGLPADSPLAGDLPAGGPARERAAAALPGGVGRLSRAGAAQANVRAGAADGAGQPGRTGAVDPATRVGAAATRPGAGPAGNMPRPAGHSRAGRVGRPTNAAGPTGDQAGGRSDDAQSGRSAVPIRAEDVLGVTRRAPSAADMAWWSRPRAGAPAPSRGFGVGRLPAGPPAVPITGGMTERGLPMRVPMAQLPDGPAAAAPASLSGVSGPVPAAARGEIDPVAVGGALARFYGGVRAALAEDVPVPAGRTGERLEEERQ